MDIIDKLATVWGEFVDVDGWMGVEVGESTVDLVVVWDTATTEGLDDAEECICIGNGRMG